MNLREENQDHNIGNFRDFYSKPLNLKHASVTQKFRQSVRCSADRRASHAVGKAGA